LLETVALSVDFACISGTIRLAAGSVEAPELVTAWQTPPTTPSHEPCPTEPRAFGETTGSVPVAPLVTLPLQVPPPSQTRIAPAADAADGPATSRLTFTGEFPASACTAPEPVDATEVDCSWHVPPPALQLAVPVEVRILPLATAPSNAPDEVCTVPEQVLVAQLIVALEDDVDDGPVSFCPFNGFPVTGSRIT
jgi:hypothetical protein